MGASVSGAGQGNRAAIVVTAADPNFAASLDSATHAGTWGRTVGSACVVAVLTHADVNGRATRPKYIRTPPLAATGAEPRGAAWVTAGNYGARAYPLSYAAGGAITAPQGPGSPPSQWGAERGDWFSTLTNNPARSMAATVWWIAFLAAVLTVAALWKIPEPTTPNATGTAQPPGSAVPGSTPTPVAQQIVPAGAILLATQPSGSVFESNLGRTVISGFTGIAIVTVLTDLWNTSGFNGQALYVRTFVSWFLLLLVASALVRGYLEAHRSHLADEYRPPLVPQSARLRKRQEGTGGKKRKNPGREGGQPATPNLEKRTAATTSRNHSTQNSPDPHEKDNNETGSAAAHAGAQTGSESGVGTAPSAPGSTLSHSDPASEDASASDDPKQTTSPPSGPTWQVFMDTFLNVLLGRNQAESVVWERRVIAHHDTLLSAAHRIREQLSVVLGEALRRCGENSLEEKDFRVSISLMASSGDHAFYISSARRSIGRVFGLTSVAMVSLRSMQARWYKQSYLGQHQRLASKFQLSGKHGGPVTLDTPVHELHVVKNGQPVGVLGCEVWLDGNRADGTSLPKGPLKFTAGETVRDILRRLNSHEVFGGGQRQAHVSLDSTGCLLITDESEQPAGSKPSLILEVFTKAPEHETPTDTAATDSKKPDECKCTMPEDERGKRGELPFSPVVMRPVELFAKGAGDPIPGYAVPVLLDYHVEARGVHDYDAFVVIPFPWVRGGTITTERRGAIHISFRRTADIDALWSGLDRVVDDNTVTPNYDAHTELLKPEMLRDPILRAVLEQSLRVLGELVQPLNDNLYKSRFGRRI